MTFIHYVFFRKIPVDILVQHDGLGILSAIYCWDDENILKLHYFLCNDNELIYKTNDSLANALPLNK